MPHPLPVDPMSVDPDALLAAAAAIEEQAATLTAAHTEWDSAVHTALPGWIGQSRRALEELAGHWTADSVALNARLCDVAASLRVSAASFAEADRVHARALRR